MKKAAFFSIPILVIGLFLGNSANAAVILTIEGTSGSADFSITGSGSNTLTASVSNQTTAYVRIPTAGGWQNPFSSIFGDIIIGTPTFVLPASSGGVTLSTMGSVAFSRIHMGLRVNPFSGPDKFALTTGSSVLPALIAGDIVSLSGTAFFTLQGGLTFDTLWNVGNYNVTPAPDGGAYLSSSALLQQPSRNRPPSLSWALV